MHMNMAKMYEGLAARERRSRARLVAETIKNIRRPTESDRRPRIGAPMKVAPLLRETRIPGRSYFREVAQGTCTYQTDVKRTQ